jgi:tight adherence protein C
MDMYLVGILVLCSIALIVYACLPKRGMDHDALKRRMLGRRGLDVENDIKAKGKESTAQKMLERMAPLAIKPVMPKDQQEVSMLRVKLSNAGFRQENAPNLFLASKTVLGIGMALVAVSWMLGTGRDFNDVMMWTVGAGGVGFMGPNYWLSIATRARGEKIRNGLPDSMDLLVISVESGLGLDAAMQRVGDEMRLVHPELSEEMEIVTYENQMGIPRSEALDNMAVRTGVPEIRSLVAVITQAERFGTSVAKALRNQAEALRVKRRQAAEEAAQKTTVKLMLPLILFIFPAIFVVLVGPAVLQLMDSFSEM